MVHKQLLHLFDKLLKNVVICPLMLVDFPGRESLLEIYGSFVRALVKLTPEIRNMSDTLTTAMTDVYQKSQSSLCIFTTST